MSDQEKPELTADQARALLAQERQRRVAACAAELQQLLERHACMLVPEITLAGESMRARVVIVAKEG